MNAKKPKTEPQPSTGFRKMVAGSSRARILGWLFLATLHSGMALADVGADLQLAPVPRRAVLKEAGYVVWGASMVQDDTGVCHLFYARWKGSLGDWCQGGEIVRATATDPLGPYTPREVVLGPRPEGVDVWDGLSVYNPTVVRFGNKYYLYYSGCNGSNFPILMPDGTFKKSPKGVLITQRIGVAVADHPAGPWRRMEQPLIDVSSEGIDSQMCTNPSVTQGGDGTFLMIYKCSDRYPRKGAGGIYLTVATAESPTGPFKKTQRKIITHPQDRFPAEDPFVWWQDGTYQCIVDDQRGSLSGAHGLVRFESQDGMDWKQSTPFVVSRCQIHWADGQTEIMRHLERPQVWFKDGKPAVLFAAVSKGEEYYNVHIPLITGKPLAQTESSDIQIIPKPQEIQRSPGHYTLTAETAIRVQSPELQEIGHYLAECLTKATGLHFPTEPTEPVSGGIVLKLDPAGRDLGNEGYTLTCTTQGVTISAPTPAGVFYGVQTLRQLLPAKIGDSPLAVALSVPCVTIKDWPRFYKNSDWNLSLIHRGLLEDDLKILNYYQQQPPVIQELFSTAYKGLGADKNATFSKCPELCEACRKNGITHLGGPMLGALAADGARVWMRTVEPAQVKVLVTVDGAEKVFGPVASTAASDLTAVVQVNGLKPDSRYPYRVTINDKPIAMPPTSVITTAPKASQNGKVNIAFGADFHKTGIQNGQLLDLVRDRHNAAFLVYGDIAVQDRRNHFGRHRADYLLRDFSRPWQNLVAAVPVYATWDDHDYFDDDLAGIPEGFTAADRAAVSQAWQQAWNNPSAGFGDERGGIFFRTRIGPCDIIMLDTRSLRGSDKADTSGDSSPFLGGAQLRWLEQQLLDCKGPFIILSSGTMWSDYVSNGKDSWGKVDRPTRERIFQFIEDKKIGGVLLLSGDRHGARGFQIPRPSGFTFHEFEIGSLGGHHKGGPPAWAPDRSKQLFGFELISAFGEFDINAALPDPEVTFRLIQDTGKELYTITLKRSQLTPPSKTGQTL